MTFCPLKRFDFKAMDPLHPSVVKGVMEGLHHLSGVQHAFHRHVHRPMRSHRCGAFQIGSQHRGMTRAGMDVTESAFEK